MMLTRAQREALKRVYDRPVSDDPETQAIFRQHPGLSSNPSYGSYRQFRRLVQPIPCDSAVMVPWCGMWLGIEPDGYTHS